MNESAALQSYKFSLKNLYEIYALVNSGWVIVGDERDEIRMQNKLCNLFQHIEFQILKTAA